MRIIVQKEILVYLLILFILKRQNSLVQAEIEIGDGLPDIRLTTKCLEALKQAGFEVNIHFLLRLIGTKVFYIYDN
jgi:hypothetical protein